MGKILKWVGGIFLVLIVIGIFVGDDDTSIDNASNSSAEPSLVETLRPQVQTDFVNFVINAQKEAKTADNDMQKGGVLAKRDKKICDILSSKRATDWTGTVKTVSSNNDGKGVLSIAIAKNVDITTWNNAFSDTFDKTLIEPGTSLFNAAASLKKNEQVKFSGQFISDSEGCLGTQNLSLTGKVSKPDFTFRFSNVSVLK